MGQRYHLKEDWRALFRAQTPAEARQTWEREILNAEAGDHAAGTAWARMIRRQRREILGHGTSPQRWTNGLIEGYHTKIKPRKRLSDGFRYRDRYRRTMFLGFLPLTAIPQ